MKRLVIERLPDQDLRNLYNPTLPAYITGGLTRGIHQDIITLSTKRIHTPIELVHNIFKMKCTPLEIVEACCRLNKITEQEKKMYLRTFDFHTQKDIKMLWYHLGNKFTKSSLCESVPGSISYRSSHFILGMPKASLEKSCNNNGLINTKYYNKQDYKEIFAKVYGKKYAKIFANEPLTHQFRNSPETEESTADVDAKISGAKFLLRNLQEFNIDFIHGSSFASTFINDIYGKNGQILMKLVCCLPEFGLPWLMNSLEKVIAHCQMNKDFIRSPLFKVSEFNDIAWEIQFSSSQMLEVVRRIKTDKYNFIPQKWEFAVENVSFFPYVIDRYIATNRRNGIALESLGEVYKITKTTTKLLRTNGCSQPFILNYHQVRVLVSVAFMCSTLQNIRNLSIAAGKVNSLTLEIGTLDESCSIPERVINIIVDSIIKKVKGNQIVREIATYFRGADFNQISDLYQLILLTIRTIFSDISQTEDTFSYYNVIIEDGTIEIQHNKNANVSMMIEELILEDRINFFYSLV